MAKQALRGWLSVLVLLGAAQRTNAQNPDSLLWAGPMLGFGTPTECLLWVQTTQPCQVAYEYWPKGQPENAQRSETHYSETEEFHVVKIRLKPLLPNTRYEYALLLNGRRIARPYRLSFRTPPDNPAAAPEVSFVAGSCKFVMGDIFSDPRQTRKRTFPIFGHMAALQPDLMLWLGDNVYMRRKDHGDSLRVNRRHAYERAFPTLQPLLGSANNYAIWDDHDFGPNDCDGTFAHKNLNLRAHQRFWANDCYGMAHCVGTFSQFAWADLDFFLLDNRYHRSPHTQAQPTMLDSAQLHWLLQGLADSRASFKFVLVGNQVLSASTNRNPHLNSNFFNLYYAEYNQLVQGIRERDIQNVVFITGDRHFSEFSVLDTSGVPVMHDLTFSPLTSPGMLFFGRERNPRRVPGSYYGRQNFGHVSVKGPAGSRLLVARTVNKRGKPKREIAITQR